MQRTPSPKLTFRSLKVIFPKKGLIISPPHQFFRDYGELLNFGCFYVFSLEIRDFWKENCLVFVWPVFKPQYLMDRGEFWTSQKRQMDGPRKLKAQISQGFGLERKTVGRHVMLGVWVKNLWNLWKSIVFWGVVSPQKRGEITLVTHLSKAIYRGYSSLWLFIS